VVCCGIVNRGAAIYEGLIIRALMDDRIIALDAKTGKQVWMVSSPEPVTHANGYAMTGAPLIVDGVVITGVAGAESSHRGLLEGYDAKTGKHLWRTYTIPAKGEPGSETWEGDSALTGGGSSWVTGTYDPELDLVYWGIGNPAPWNARARKGDNLYTNSIVAIRPKTGRPIVTDVFTGALEGKQVTVWPSISGVTNWQSMSFSPQTGMLYVNTLHVGMTYEAPEAPKLKPGAPAGAPTVKRTVVTDDP